MRALIIVGGLALLAGAVTFYPAKPTGAYSAKPTVTVPKSVQDRYSPVLYSFDYDNEPEQRQLTWIAIVAEHAMPDINRFTPRCEGFKTGKVTEFRSVPSEKLLGMIVAHDCGPAYSPNLPALKKQFVEHLCLPFILSPWGKKGFTLDGKIDFTGTGKTLRLEVSEKICRTALAGLRDN